jgi:hypothetical protein
MHPQQKQQAFRRRAAVEHVKTSDMRRDILPFIAAA